MASRPGDEEKGRQKTEIAEPLATTVRYVEEIFGPGSGARHAAFLDQIRNDALRDAVHRCHAVEADTTFVSLEENYLLGMCVLAALRSYGTAAMFAKVLMHLGTPREKILEAVGRLSMWVGPLPATEASFIVQRAIDEYEAQGKASLDIWFPETAEAPAHDTPTMPPPSSTTSPGHRGASSRVGGK
ncbi:MAG: hypothetical protein ABW133_16715 [Polyangiaceae bacterium]